MSSSLFNRNQQVNQNQMPQLNPQQMQIVNAFLSKTGFTPEQAVRNICEQRGIDVDGFMAQFQR